MHSKHLVRGSTNLESEPDARSLSAAKAKELKTPEALPMTKGLSIGHLTLKATGPSKVKHSNICIHMRIYIYTHIDISIYRERESHDLQHLDIAGYHETINNNPRCIAVFSSLPTEPSSPGP